MTCFTFTWRCEDGGDFFSVEITAPTKSEAHDQWLKYCDGYWDTDDLFFFLCAEGTIDEVHHLVKEASNA